MADAGVGEAAAAEGAKSAGEAAAAEGAAGAAASEGTAAVAAGSAAEGAGTVAAGSAAGGAATGEGLGAGGSLLGSAAAGDAAMDATTASLTTEGGVASSGAGLGAESLASTPTAAESLSNFASTPVGKQVISAGLSSAASTLMQSMMAPGKLSGPSVPKVNAMPTANSAEVMAAKKKSIAEQMQSRGRTSTILTDKLG